MCQRALRGSHLGAGQVKPGHVYARGRACDEIAEFDVAGTLRRVERTVHEVPLHSGQEMAYLDLRDDHARGDLLRLTEMLVGPDQIDGVTFVIATIEVYAR